jgi:hypothetical protein
MNGRHSAIAVAISLATSAPALAGASETPAYTPRQLAHCIMKRVRANTAEPYRDAFKACKTQFDSPRSDRPADTTIAAASFHEDAKH